MGRLGRAVHHAAHAKDLQPDAGPVRAGGHHIQHLLGLADRTTSEACTGVMDDVFKFAATFKDYPPRSVPPSFNPANIMEDTLRDIKAKQKLETAFPMLKTNRRARRRKRPGGATDVLSCDQCGKIHRPADQAPEQRLNTTAGHHRPCFISRPVDSWFDKSWKPGDFELVK